MTIPGAGSCFTPTMKVLRASSLQAPPKRRCAFIGNPGLRRQIRIRGLVTTTSDEEADEYYATRPRGSQLGAWASKQSQPMAGRFALEKAVAYYTAKHPIGKIPRPPHWSGFRVSPLEIEFWHDRPFRLHDRLAFTRDDLTTPWTRAQLFP